ncbi:hypothetical protein HPY28_21130 [Brevibacillus sp. HB1.2]|uniref:hypothetical protein n=1 Tax=Brevibacillus sp. HB1.2 TaxID=2738807 RepID=UPI00036DC0E3|nr:hypothetical protein [Brevibacillus sp. HB1.2]ATF11724.1 hypothetical protein A616_06900 [Brevibacillus brevis X23]NTU22830.1 hypothetical protein [Brevibacillus sp. HB1.2]
MRDRNIDGRYRQKRGDTHVGTIEEKYGLDFGVRRDMHLETLRKREGGKSLTQIIKEYSDNDDEQ